MSACRSDHLLAEKPHCKPDDPPQHAHGDVPLISLDFQLASFSYTPISNLTNSSGMKYLKGYTKSMYAWDLFNMAHSSTHVDCGTMADSASSRFGVQRRVEGQGICSACIQQMKSILIVLDELISMCRIIGLYHLPLSQAVTQTLNSAGTEPSFYEKARSSLPVLLPALTAVTRCWGKSHNFVLFVLANALQCMPLQTFAGTG